MRSWAVLPLFSGFRTFQLALAFSSKKGPPVLWPSDLCPGNAKFQQQIANLLHRPESPPQEHHLRNQRQCEGQNRRRRAGRLQQDANHDQCRQ